MPQDEELEITAETDGHQVLMVLEESKDRNEIRMPPDEARTLANELFAAAIGAENNMEDDGEGTEEEDEEEEAGA